MCASLSVGDDFVVEGQEETLAWVRVVLEAKYIVKARGVLGPEPKVERALTFLKDR